MKTLQQELIDFKNWYNKSVYDQFTNIEDCHINEYLKSINSNSDCERRAIGSNEQADEACECSIKAVDETGKHLIINICDKHKDYTTG